MNCINSIPVENTYTTILQVRKNYSSIMISSNIVIIENEEMIIAVNTIYAIV